MLKRSWLALGVVMSLGWVSHAVADAAKPKIGFILSTMQEERYQKDKAAFEAAVTKMGGTVVFASCNNNEQTQAAEVDNVLSKGVDALVIQAVNGDTATAFVKQANGMKVPVIAYDRLIKNAALDGYVTEDSMKTGELQAEAAVKFTQGKGNYIILMGQAGHSAAEERTAGVMKVLKKYPNIKIVSQQYHDAWSPDRAMKTVENVLTANKNNIQAIIANNSGMAHGAVQAVEEQGLAGKIFIAGADADLANIRNMVAGKQHYEVAIPIDVMAGRAAEVAMALAKKQTFKFDSQVDNGYKVAGKPVLVKTVNAPVVGVDKGQIDERIVRSGFHAKDAVYGKVAQKK